jgi:hypothetical protein
MNIEAFFLLPYSSDHGQTVYSADPYISSQILEDGKTVSFGNKMVLSVILDELLCIVQGFPPLFSFRLVLQYSEPVGQHHLSGNIYGISGI